MGFRLQHIKVVQPEYKGNQDGRGHLSGGFQHATKVSLEGKDFVSKAYLDSSKEVRSPRRVSLLTL